MSELGSGARFKALAKKTGSPALAAWIGRKKYGKRKFQELSEQGKRDELDQKAKLAALRRFGKK